MSPTQHTGQFPLASHFASPQQQIASGKLAMALFLAAEVLLFGGVICAYVVFRNLHHDAFVNAHRYVDLTMGTVSTLVLLFASLTASLAVRSAKTNNQGGVWGLLLVTVVSILAFLAIKYVECTHFSFLGLLPGGLFTASSVHLPNPDQAHVFFGFFFLMTGLMAVHLVLGALILLWMALRAQKGEFGSHFYLPLEIATQFVHVMALVWAFVFPLLYLVH